MEKIATMNETEADWIGVRNLFKQIWGYEDFRPPQGEIIRSLLASRDAIAIMPTGGGKSICFQLPALLRNGLTLVISPLVALMENQVKELKERQLPADLLHNELPRSDRQQTLKKLERQSLRLLYLSPETLLSPPVWERLSLPYLKINGLMLDEAHCLVQWGETFRPAYRRLGAVRPALLKFKPPGTKIAIAAFTATADSTTQTIIQNTLQLQQPDCFERSPYRSNLHLQVKIAWTPQCRRHQLLGFIQTRKSQSGLVYVRSRRDSEIIAQWLRTLNYATAAYHAGLSPQERRYLETNWLQGKLQFVVSTSAFGMGVNKPDCRWIVHFQAPTLLSEYLQEIGRGGRDGKPSYALTSIAEPSGWLDPEDKQRNRFFRLQVHKQYRQAREIAQKIPPQGTLEAIARQFPEGEITLALLHRVGQLEWLDPFHYRLKGRSATLSFNEIDRQQQLLQSQMRQYFTTRKCRWQFILNAFGWKSEANFKCGHCDNCR